MNVEQLSINTIRVLSAEAIQKAKSGHPGLPMGCAPMAYTLWAKHINQNPANPEWLNRDRFVLSSGHGSMLVYSLLHLFGFGLTIEDLKQFRQYGSLTPGHPEYKHTKGVETTTGPLGQGIANAIGMAWTEKYLAAKFNRPGFEIVNHYSYAICGDGCLMEGISAEAASLAGTLGLGKMILLYDSNNISIEGDTNIAFRENVAKRFEAYGWQVIYVEDGTNTDAIDKAITLAKEDTDRPTLIEIKTKIGHGSPNKQGKASAHGEPLGEEELVATKKNLGWEYEQSFYVPEEVKTHMLDLQKASAQKEAKWNELFAAYAKEYPELYKEFEQWNSEDLAVDLLNNDDFWTYEGNLATRISSEQVLNKAAKLVPNLFGGSADLSPSTKTIMKDRGSFSKENPQGANLHFGIREHAMAAIANGMALHGGVRPYIATFFVFSDYMKPSMRLAALMGIPVINVLTHDSIGVGEDGPTHEPIEQLAMLRSIPNFTVFRPCDTHETAAGWYAALTRKTSPTGLVLTRQNLTLLPETGKDALKGAYILRQSVKAVPDIILIASGSEVELIYKAYDVLKEKGVDARVVSMPSMELFEEQTAEYKESILPKAVRARLAVEAATSFGWYKYIGLDGDMISMDTFGASGPANILFKEFGFTVENVVDKALKVLGK
jgi:transketolase